MERKELNAHSRETGKGVSRKLRKGGNVPAVLYGVGRESQPLYVNRRELDRVVSTEAGWNILLDLNINGKDKVLSRISDYQSDVLNRELTHIDFQVLDLKKKLKTEVPIRLVGTSEGVKKGGILEMIRREIEVKCFPTNIPEHIDVDISGLDIGGNIHIEDIPVPEGVEFIYDTNFSVAAVVAPTVVTAPEIPTEEEVVEEGAPPAEGEEAPPAEGKAAPAEGKEAKEGEKKKKE